MNKALIFVLPCMYMLTACDTKDWESAGYQDGYAATINVACDFRATMVHGKYDNADYAGGYSRGANAGALAVAKEGCENLE
jgi:hypothetical protein